VAQPVKKKWNFTLRTFLGLFILLTCAIYWVHDHYWVLHLKEVGRYSIVVDYDMSIEEGVVAGKYDWKNPDINSINFPVESDKFGRLKREAIVIQIDRLATTEEILKRMDKEDYEPASLQELLAFGESYPFYWRHSWVVALGSNWQDSFGDRRASGLFSYDGGRGLGLFYYDNQKEDFCCFLVFRK